MKKLLVLALLLTSVAHAEVFKIEEFSSVESLEAAEMDAAAQAKINFLIPRIARRFCNSKVRPTYVTVSIYLVQVQWSLDRICGEQEIPGRTETDTGTETTNENVETGIK